MPVSRYSYPASPPRRPRRGRRLVEHEPVAIGAVSAVRQGAAGRQRRLRVAPCLVLGRAADLDHLHPIAGLQHPMADGGRLQEAVALLQQHRLALVFVGHAHPAVAVDHLEPDVVEVHVVGHRPTVGDEDVGGDEAPAQPAGDEVAIVHPGAALAEGAVVIGHACEHELFPQRRDLQRWVGGRELDDGAVGCGDRGRLAIGGEQPQVSRRCGTAHLEAQGEAEALQHCHAWVVGGHDGAHLEADAGEEVDGGGDRLAARQHDLRRLDVVRAHAPPSLRTDRPLPLLGRLGAQRPSGRNSSRCARRIAARSRAGRQVGRGRREGQVLVRNSGASTPSATTTSPSSAMVQLRIGRSKWPAVKRPASSLAPVEYTKLPA